MTDDELLKQAKDWLQAAKDASKDWRDDARECYAFRDGQQYSTEELADLEEQLRPAIAFNRIQPMVAAVVGQQINNRMEVRYLPREQGDVEPSEILTGAAAWADDECDAEDELTEVFTDLVTGGMGWSETYISYDEDIDGKIHTAERFDPMEAFWDHTAKRQNLKDAKWLGRGRWIRRSLAETQWPDAKDIDWNDFAGLAGEEGGNESIHDASRAHTYENDARQWYDRHKDEVFVFQLQWWEHKPIYRVGSPQGRLQEITEAQFKRVKDQIEEMGVPYVRQLRKHYYQAFILGPKVVERGDSPDPENFTLRCVTGKRDRNSNCWYGLVRGMIDPQRWANKFYADIQDIMVSNRQGGAFVETGALIDQREAEEHWNDPNPLILVSPGALQNGQILERQPIPYPQGMDRMLEWAVQSMPAVTGINLEMMGFANRDQPNVLEVQRKRSALTVLADLFDGMRRFNKERGRVVLNMIQAYIADGRLIRITGKNGLEQYVPLALDETDMRYDIIVDEAATSPNQRSETFAVLTQLIPFLAKMGVMPPPEVIEYLPLPSSLTAAWKKAMQPKEQPSPEEQMAMAEKKAEIEKTQSETVENYSQAEENRSQVALNRIKAITEGME